MLPGRKLCAPGGREGGERRVGERLQAALAGLQELRLLKEKHSDMVSWALRMDREDTVPAAVCSPPAALQTGSGTGTGAEEQRLEATLSALKQQLSRLRRQDVGLKTHLQQLDQQITELKLDVCKAPEEPLESDSRPSSGFYELSDSNSLSNSCTSVYSDCLSSSSQTSIFLPPSSPGTPHPLGPPSQADASRRRSADETAVQPNPPRAAGLYLAGGRIRAGVERGRQRPVSTGDLDRMMTMGLGYHKPADTKKSPLCPNLRPSAVDPKFQSNLVSRSGTEVYHYPSPLHAVALHSPIFSPGGDPTSTRPLQGPGPPEDGGVHSMDTVQRARVADDSKSPGYIDRLLQRSAAKTNPQSEAGKETPSHALVNSQMESVEVGTLPPEVPKTQFRQPQSTSAQASNIISADIGERRRCMVYSSQEQVDLSQRRRCMVSSSQEQVDLSQRRRCMVSSSQEQVDLSQRRRCMVSSSQEQVDLSQRRRAPEACHRYSYPAALREFSSSDVITSTISTSDTAPAGAVVRANLERRYAENTEPMAASETMGLDRKPVASSSLKREEGRDSGSHTAHTAPTDFVHAEFVPAGSQRVKVRQADRKTKAVRLRRRSSEKMSRASRHQQVCASSERVREPSGGAGRGERQPRRTGKGRMTHKLTHSLGEERRHSESDSSLCGPGFPYNQRIRPKTPPIPAATKPGNNRRPQSLDVEHSAEQGKRRQAAARWLSEVEICQAAGVQRCREAAGGRPMARGATARPLSGHLSSHTFQPSMSAYSYFNSLNSRYPPAPFPPSSHCPPRCESEYSADCASLFHSTIAESSEGETSDNTANRFGDSESSQSYQSDSDSSLSVDEEKEAGGGLVWAEAALGPASAGPPLQQPHRPEPLACRIKASRALKKKIRRFQPASLKVMTLV